MESVEHELTAMRERFESLQQQHEAMQNDLASRVRALQSGGTLDATKETDTVAVNAFQIAEMQRQNEKLHSIIATYSPNFPTFHYNWSRKQDFHKSHPGFGLITSFVEHYLRELKLSIYIFIVFPGLCWYFQFVSFRFRELDAENRKKLETEAKRIEELQKICDQRTSEGQAGQEKIEELKGQLIELKEQVHRHLWISYICQISSSEFSLYWKKKI